VGGGEKRLKKGEKKRKIGKIGRAAKMKNLREVSTIKARPSGWQTDDAGEERGEKARDYTPVAGGQTAPLEASIRKSMMPRASSHWKTHGAPEPKAEKGDRGGATGVSNGIPSSSCRSLREKKQFDFFSWRGAKRGKSGKESKGKREGYLVSVGSRRKDPHWYIPQSCLQRIENLCGPVKLRKKDRSKKKGTPSNVEALDRKPPLGARRTTLVNANRNRTRRKKKGSRIGKKAKRVLRRTAEKFSQDPSSEERSSRKGRNSLP